MKKRHKYHSVLVTGLACLTLISAACNSGRNTNGLNSTIMEAVKPVVDTTMVLKTLDLYRAKRYEGLQDAFAAGAENVYKMSFHGRKMKSLSPDISRLTYLASLDVAYNELTYLPEEISGLHYLQGLYANNNMLARFPGQILLLPVLAKVDLSGNRIGEIPEEISRMDQLSRLSLDNNAIMQIPVGLYKLANLKVLELAGNGLSSIPEGISRLTDLRKLDLSKNQLSGIPKELATMTGHLEELNIQGNQIPLDEIKWFVEAMPSTTIRY